MVLLWPIFFWITVAVSKTDTLSVQQLSKAFYTDISVLSPLKGDKLLATLILIAQQTLSEGIRKNVNIPCVSNTVLSFYKAF